MAEKTQAEKDAAERVSKAEWMNDQLDIRLHQNDEQPGVAPAPDARDAAPAKVSPRRRTAKATDTP